MAERVYRGRRAFSIENADMRVTLLVEGGHLAELTHKPTGVNPMWTPPWPSIEPSTFDPASHASVYGAHAESKLLSGIMGHNLCMDIFGGTSDEEAAAGLTPHGEGSIVAYTMQEAGDELVAKATFPHARLAFERRIRLEGPLAVISESVRNTSATDRPIAWTQHVTLGPPFLEKGRTMFRTTATKARVYETDFAGDLGRYQPGVNFDWPNVPLKTGGTLDLQVLPDVEKSGGYTTQFMDPEREHAHFLAWTPSSQILCGYAWRRSDFPWLGIWEENYSRTIAPWNGETLTRGMEFGVSPMPESRRRMIDRGGLFGVPGYRWIPALTEVKVTYCAFVTIASQMPRDVQWNGSGEVRMLP